MLIFIFRVLSFENVLNRAFIENEYSKIWISDIAYIQSKKGFVYLTIIMNLYDRKNIDWILSDGMSVEQTSLAAWRMAINNQSIEKGLVFYSDRGIEYASKKFTNVIDYYNGTSRIQKIILLKRFKI